MLQSLGLAPRTDHSLFEFNVLVGKWDFSGCPTTQLATGAVLGSTLATGHTGFCTARLGVWAHSVVRHSGTFRHAALTGRAML